MIIPIDPKERELVARIVSRAQLGSGDDFTRTPKDWATLILTALAESRQSARSVPEGFVLVPADPGSCELDDSGWLLAFARELHGNIAEENRPLSWSDFSDAQRERLQRAYRAMLAAAPTPNREERS